MAKMKFFRIKNSQNRKKGIGLIESIIMVVIALIGPFALEQLERKTMLFVALLLLVPGALCIVLPNYLEKRNKEETEESYLTEDEIEDKKKRKGIRAIVFGFGMGLCICSAFVFLERARDYAFVSGEFLPFWEMSLIVGAIAGVIAFVLLRGKEQKKSTLIIYIVVVVLLSVIFASQIFSHLNYALDTSDPQRYIAVIEDKDHTNYRKSSDTYEFTVTAGGERFDLNVPRSVYRSYDVGDIIEFNKYKGFFGKEFFVFGD